MLLDLFKGYFFRFFRYICSINYFMKILFVRGIISIVVFFCLGACHDEKIKPQKERTVLVYIAGDNNLSYFSSQNMEGMMKGMKEDNGNLIVYWDQPNVAPKLLELEVMKNGSVKQRVIKEYKEENSASPAVLARVIRETQKLYPAKSYGLVLWSHGTGWFPESPSVKARSFGEDHGSEMDIKELAAVIPDKSFHYIIFDACLMGAVEVFYELRNKADYIIASPTLVPAKGLPYEQVVPYFWGEDSDLEKICEAYYDFNNTTTETATITLIKTSELEALYVLCQEILEGKLPEVQTQDKSSVYRYYVPLAVINYTFYDFADLIRQVATREELAKFDAQLKKVVLYCAATRYFWDYVPVDKDRFSGISTYVPFPDWPGLNNYYFTLSWSGVYGL